MDVEVKLALSRTDLVIGESADLTITFTNTSAAPVTLLDPQRSPLWPRIHVRNSQTGKEEVYRPGGVAAKENHDFQTPLPPINMNLAPGQHTDCAGDLLTWVALPAPGKYMLTAEMEVAGQVLVSSPITVTVQPLNLRAAFIVGGDSGYNPYRYCAWAQAAGNTSAVNGSAVLLTCVMFDVRGKPVQTQSVRLADRNLAVHPLPSVPPNGHPFPVQWLAWLEGDQFSGLYVEQGQIKVPIHSHPLHLPGAEVIGPGLLDIHQADSDHPARGQFALWQPATPHAHLLWRTWEPGGALTSEPGVDVASGTLRWGRATLLTNGERRVALAVQRGETITVELARWGAAAPASVQKVTEGAGQFLGAGMTLDSEDRLSGLLLLRGTSGHGVCTLHSWHMDANGTIHTDTGSPLPGEGLPQITRALVEISPQQRALLLLQTSDQRWHVSIGGGAPTVFPAALAAYGEPIAAYWRDEATPFVVMAGAQTGITYHKFP